MKLRSLLFVLALSSFLLFGCSSKDSAKASPTPPDTSGTTGTTGEEGTSTGSPATGTTQTPSGVKPITPEETIPTASPTTEGTEETSSTPASTPAGTMVTTSTDTELATAVQDKLKESDSASASSISVLAQDGVVTLKGTVSSQEEADQIIVIVKTVPNVKEVISKLNVESK